jgi:ribosome-associated protein
MDLRKLQRVIVDALEDIKGQDIKVFNTEHLSDMFERVIVASGTSNRQTRALASSVVEKVKQAGGYIVSVEGEDTGEWVLVDCGEVVVHILQPTFRAYYNLEEIWGGKPVRLKSATAATPAPAARKSPTRTAAASRAAGTGPKSAAHKTAKRATSARKTAAGKTAPKRRAS